MQKVNYVRLYTDESGESHFEDIELELAPVDFVPPAAPVKIAPFLPLEQSILAGLPAGWSSDVFHTTRSASSSSQGARRQLLCMLQGELNVTASDGTSRYFPVGSILLLEDTWGKGHLTRMTSEGEGLFFVATVAEPGES